MSEQNPGRCPDCGGELSVVAASRPWCAACEWNLATYDPAVLPPRGWLWLERWGHGSAGRHDARLLADYSGTPPDRLHSSGARVVLVGISAVLAVAAVGCVVLGAALTLRDFPSGWVLPGLALVFELLLWAISRVFLLLHLGLLALGLRDHQRAEIRADAIASRAAGSDALTALLDRLILTDRLVRLVSDSSVRVPPAGWSGLAEILHDRERSAMQEYRQFSRRATSLWSAHPPLGVRTRLVESWPREEPVVVLSDGQWGEIDRELQPWYTAAHRAVLGPRDYHPAPSADAAGR